MMNALHNMASLIPSLKGRIAQGLMSLQYTVSPGFMQDESLECEEEPSIHGGANDQLKCPQVDKGPSHATAEGRIPGD